MFTSSKVSPEKDHQVLLQSSPRVSQVLNSRPIIWGIILHPSALTVEVQPSVTTPGTLSAKISDLVTQSHHKQVALFWNNRIQPHFQELIWKGVISRGLVLSFSRRCTHQNCWPPIGQKGLRERSYWLHKVGTAAIWSRLQALFKLGAVTFCFGSVRPSLVVQAFGVSFRLAFTMASLTMMLKWKLHQ